jgi:thioredoxin reductase (NADPH)
MNLDKWHSERWSGVRDVRDVIVVGSGPAGYTAAIYAARARLRPLVLEGSVGWGGALMNTTEVENFPGFRDGLMGPSLMQEMREQAQRFGADLLAEDAIEMSLDGNLKVISEESGRQYWGRSVILAMGSRYREIGLANEKRLAGFGVSWCATCDGFFFQDQDIAVVGGGDSALEEATFLTRFARKVFVIHRRDRLRASKVMQERAFADEKIEFIWNADVVDVLGAERVSGVRLQDTVTGASQELGLTGLFIAIGHDPRSELVRAKVHCDPNGYVVVEYPSTRTSADGVFAAGDLVDHIYRQAVTAAGSGCQAALDAERYLASNQLSVRAGSPRPAARP